MKNSAEKYQFIEIYGALLADMLALFLSYFLGYTLRFGKFDARNYENEFMLALIGVMLMVCILYNILGGGYNKVGRRGYFDELVYVCKYTFFLLMGMSVALYMAKAGSMFSRLFIAYFILIHIEIDYFFRQTFKLYLRNVYKEGAGSEKFIVITTSNRLKDLHDHIQADKAWSYEVTGVCLLDRTLEELIQDTAGAEGEQGDELETYFEILSGPDNILETIRLSAVDSVLLLVDNANAYRISNMVENILKMGINVSLSLDIMPNSSATVLAGKFAKFPVISYNMSRITYRQMMVKRLVDIFVGIIGSILTCIITPFIALAIKLDSKGPVFFMQERIGKNGRRFNIIKFRSMYQDAEERKKALMDQNEMDGYMFKMENDPRVTKVGAFLRKTSLDEFPQFWSVLIGDMTLIGTRPPTVDEFEMYNEYYRRRISMKPGLTGLWQVSGRSDITDFDEVVKLDLEYIDNWSLAGDIKIIFQTIYVVLFGRGAK